MALRQPRVLLGAQLGGALALYGAGVAPISELGLLGVAAATAAASAVQLVVLVAGLARLRKRAALEAGPGRLERLPGAA
jgi:Na+-driven multidrug efflux pump